MLFLSTVAMLVLLISTLRFAIKCYGHHHQQNTLDNSTSQIGIIGKTLEAIGKSITQNQP